MNILDWIVKADSNSDEFGNLLTQKLQEVIPSDYIVLITIDEEIQSGYALSGKSPAQNKLDEKLSWIFQMAGLCADLPAPTLFGHHLPGSDISELLQRFDGTHSLLSPLLNMELRIGYLFFLNCVDPGDHPDLYRFLDVVSGILALKLDRLNFMRKADFENNKCAFALKETEEYNRLLFENSLTGLALCQVDGTLVDVNQAYADMIGRTVEETLGLSYWDITPEKYLKQEKELLNEVLTSGKYKTYEKEYVHKDGHLVPVTLRGALIELQGEQYIWSSVEDDTERRNAQNEALESARRFNNILKSVSLISVILDTGGNITFCNDFLLKLSGYTRDELIGKNWFDIFLPENIKDNLEQKFNQTIEQNFDFGFHYENPILTKSGRLLDISWTNLFLKDINGEYSGSVSLGEDITERKKANKN